MHRPAPRYRVFLFFLQHLNMLLGVTKLVIIPEENCTLQNLTLAPGRMNSN